MNSRQGDQLGGLIWLLIGVGICLGAWKINLGTAHKPGVGFMPFLTGAFLVLLGAILFLKEFGVPQKVPPPEGGWTANRNSFFLTLSALIGYILLLNFLGFLLTTFLFLFLLFKISEPQKWRSPLFFAGIMAILSYLLFSVWLQCQFPRGLLNIF